MVCCADAVPTAAAIMAAAQTPCINLLVSNMASSLLAASPAGAALSQPPQQVGEVNRDPTPQAAEGKPEGPFAAELSHLAQRAGASPRLPSGRLRLDGKRREVRALAKCDSPALAGERSGRRDAEASDEWLRNHKLVIDDLQRQRGEAARGRAIDDRRAFARIVSGIVTRALKDP